MRGYRTGDKSNLNLSGWNRLILAFLIVLVVGCVKRIPDMTSDHLNDDTAELVQAEESHADLYYMLLQAHDLRYDGNIEQALDKLNSAMELYNDLPELYVHTVYFLIDLVYSTQDNGQKFQLLKRAEAVCSEGVDKFPRNSALRKFLADLYIDSERFHAAISQFQELCKLDPENPELTVTLARLYIQTAQYDAARATLAPFEDSDAYPDALKVLGLLNGETGQFKNSVQYYLRYLELIPDEYEAEFNLAVCYVNLGEISAAESHFMKLHDHYPKAVEINVKLAEIYEKQGRYNEAIRMLKTTLDHPAVWITSSINIARMRLVQGKLDDAIENLQTVLSRAPKNRLAAFYLGLALFEKGKYEEASNVLITRLGDRPYNPPVVDLLAQILVRTGEVVDALRLVEMAIRDQPNEPEFYLILADVYGASEHKDEIERAYERGLEHFPEDRQLNMALAFRLEQNGEWKRAVKMIKKLLDKEPEDAELANFVGYTLADHDHKLKYAESLILKAVKVEPQSAAYLDSLGWVYYKLAKLELAEQHLETAANTPPEDPLILLHLAIVKDALGKREEARSIVERGLQLDPDNVELKEKQQLFVHSVR